MRSVRALAALVLAWVVAAGVAGAQDGGVSSARVPAKIYPVWTVGGEKRRGQGLDAWLASGAALLGAVALSTAVVGRSRRA